MFSRKNQNLKKQQQQNQPRYKETYDGKYENGLKHGKGTLIAKDYKYTGDWVKDKKQGEGTITFKSSKLNHHQYTGTWMNDTYNGQGTLIYDYFGKYVGEFEDGLKSGYGKEDLRNGNTYEGQYKFDMFEGNGELKNLSTEYSYNGEFSKGLPNGYGVE